MFRFDLHATFHEGTLSIGHVSQANIWAELSPSGTAPSARFGHTAVWSPAANGFYVFGGQGGPGPESTSRAARQQAAMLHCGVRRETTEANSWEQLSPSGTAPDARRVHTAVWSPAADGFYVFGGYHGCLCGNVNDLWYYGREANIWAELSPSGTAPSARFGHTAVWSPAANGFYVFGGQDGPGPESTSRAARQQAAMLHCGVRREITEAALSTTCGSTGVRMRFFVKHWQIPALQGVLLGPPSMFRFDLHATFHEDMLSIGHVSQANSWEQLSPSGTAPDARYYHTAVWSPEADGFYVFGGSDDGEERCYRPSNWDEEDV
ncbi:tea1, partial [Symbiodinium necroappetens]